jgi:hypothetical protein
MVLYSGDAEVIGNFRALNFYKASDFNIKENVRLLINGKAYKLDLKNSSINNNNNKKSIMTFVACCYKSMVLHTISREMFILIQTEDLSDTLRNKSRLLFLKLFD